MGGGLFVNALLRETGQPVSEGLAESLKKFHAEAYLKQVNSQNLRRLRVR
jgi:hypothetical protein